MTKRTFLTVGEAAKIYGIHPQELAQFLYQAKIPELQCEVVGGRRLIPASMVDDLRVHLEERGYLGREGSVLEF